jgi:hypothetical protein
MSGDCQYIDLWHHKNYETWRSSHGERPEDMGWTYDNYLKEGVPDIFCTHSQAGYSPLCITHELDYHTCCWSDTRTFPTAKEACAWGRTVHNCQPCQCGLRSVYLYHGQFLCARALRSLMSIELKAMWQ